MPINVILPPAMRELAGGAARVQADASNVGELLRNLVRDHPKAREAMFAGTGGLSPQVNVYLNGESIEDMDGLETELQDEDEIRIAMARTPR